MKRYIKDGQIKSRNQIVLHVTKTIKDKNGNDKEVKVQVINPAEEMLLEHGWVEYIIPVYEPTEEEIFNIEKEHIKKEILIYDASPEVNEFYVNGESIWLDKATRTGLLLRLQSEQILGDTETTLWYGTKKFVLPIDIAQMMLHQVEKYASQCYDNTQMHLANIEEITDIDELRHYDYTTGYPEKLNF